MFEYRNLPDSIPEDMLELYLQTWGSVFFRQVDGVLYFFGQIGASGPPDIYLRPTRVTWANPALMRGETNDIPTTGVLVKNDLMFEGILPIIDKWCTMLVELELSMNVSAINMRSTRVYTADNDTTAESAREQQRQIRKGKDHVIVDKSLIEGLQVIDAAGTSNSLTEYREAYQYIKSLMYAELGLKTASNMKKQYVSDTENIIEDESLLPFIDEMLLERQKGMDAVNKMFGTDIQVKLRGTWELQAMELEKAMEIAEEPSAEEGETPNDKQESASEETEGTGEDSGEDVTGQSEEETSTEEESNAEEDDFEDTVNTEVKTGINTANVTLPENNILGITSRQVEEAMIFNKLLEVIEGVSENDEKTETK